MAISFAPLQATLHRKGINFQTLKKEKIISSVTIAKLNRDQYVSLEVIERLCKRLNCKIEEVIEFLPDDENKRENGGGAVVG